jgi:hypothetical protein
LFFRIIFYKKEEEEEIEFSSIFVFVREPLYRYRERESARVCVFQSIFQADKQRPYTHFSKNLQMLNIEKKN